MPGQVLRLAQPLAQVALVAQAPDHVVEALGERADLVAPVHRQFGREIAGGDGPGGAHHPLDRGGVPAREVDRDDRPEREDDQRGGDPALHARLQEEVEVLGAHAQVHVAELLAARDHRERDVVDLPLALHRLSELGLEDHLLLALGDVLADVLRVGAGDDPVGRVDDRDLPDPLRVEPLEVGLEALLVRRPAAADLLEPELDGPGELGGAALELVVEDLLGLVVEQHEGRDEPEREQEHHRDELEPEGEAKGDAGHGGSCYRTRVRAIKEKEHASDAGCEVLTLRNPSASLRCARWSLHRTTARPAALHGR